MTNDPKEPDVAVSPTLGDLDDLSKAVREHRDADESEPETSHSDAAPYDEEDVTGGPTLGSIKELRFAHHAHHPDQPTREESAPE